MLLTDLLKLFANDFNINEERFVNIIESNNIRLSQRLLSEIKPQKKINIETSNTNTNDDIAINNNDTNTKKETTTRGRGRPRKTCEIKEDDSVLIEVELVKLGTNEYYKTNENVILNKDMEIEGILKNGKVVKREKW
jgi:kynureninase